MFFDRRRVGAAAVLLAAVAGCTSRSEVFVTSSGTLPAHGGYVLADGAPVQVERLVSDRLAESGLVASQSPAYLVQVSFTRRPAGIGLFLPDTEAREWLRAPDLRRRRNTVTMLTLRVVETGDGREVFHGSASSAGASRIADADGKSLLDAILSEMPRKPADEG